MCVFVYVCVCLCNRVLNSGLLTTGQMFTKFQEKRKRKRKRKRKETDNLDITSGPKIGPASVSHFCPELILSSPHRRYLPLHKGSLTSVVIDREPR